MRHGLRVHPSRRRTHSCEPEPAEHRARRHPPDDEAAALRLLRWVRSSTPCRPGQSPTQSVVYLIWRTCALSSPRRCRASGARSTSSSTELDEGSVHGSALFRTALAEVGEGTRSGPEGELFALIRRGKLPRPLFNARLFLGDELIARPDAWWPDFGVAVEVDSKAYAPWPGDLGADDAPARSDGVSRDRCPAFLAGPDPPGAWRRPRGYQEDPRSAARTGGTEDPHAAGGLNAPAGTCCGARLPALRR